MNGFKKISPNEITENTFKLIGTDWMLITAGDHTEHNCMTASWGGLGYMWNKPIAIAVIRPQRYTFEFTEREEMMTLSFFDEQWRDALKYCGTHSGRDGDKFLKTGLSINFTEEEVPCITQARLVLECRKIYTDMLRPENFIDKEIIDKWYAEADFHKAYILEIVNVYIKE